MTFTGKENDISIGTTTKPSITAPLNMTIEYNWEWPQPRQPYTQPSYPSYYYPSTIATLESKHESMYAVEDLRIVKNDAYGDVKYILPSGHWIVKFKHLINLSMISAEEAASYTIYEKE